jgi:hypothetical protein
MVPAASSLTRDAVAGRKSVFERFFQAMQASHGEPFATTEIAGQSKMTQKRPSLAEKPAFRARKMTLYSGVFPVLRGGESRKPLFPTNLHGTHPLPKNRA